METYSRTYEDLIRKMATLSEAMLDNLIIVNFLQGIDMSAYA